MRFRQESYGNLNLLLVVDWVPGVHAHVGSRSNRRPCGKETRVGGYHSTNDIRVTMTKLTILTRPRSIHNLPCEVRGSLEKMGRL